MKAAFAVLLALLLTACGFREADIPTEISQPLPQAAATPLPALKLRHDTALESQFAEIALQAGGRVGASAVLLETSDAAELNGDQQFPMQSVYKLPIAMAVLYADSHGQPLLTRKIAVTPRDFVRTGVRSPIRNLFPQGGEFSVRELLAQSISESDGTASDLLLGLAGGPQGVMAYLSRLGIADMTVADSEKDIFKDWETQYRNSATPHATVELLRSLQLGAGIAPETRQELMYLLKSSGPGRRRLKKLLPGEIEVAHKSGTGGQKDGVSSATNDVGIITLPNGKHILIAVYVSDSMADGWLREKAIAEIAKAAYDRWSGQ
ncbi:MAG TPA: class A beta-lactamase [Pyrinomonadaceae bacterium]|nr:class A beta-lactamase [Pyrinomonadaceae bacterium]